MLLALGSNGSGQLGLNDEADAHTPTVCTNAEHIVPISIKAGGNHTLVLTTTGALFGTGANPDGRSGNVSDGVTSIELRPFVTHLNEPHGFSMCAATWEASFLVSQDGQRIYSCGTGNRGELGQGREIVKSTHPTKILDLEAPSRRVVDISACMSHVIAVLADGTLYGWGAGRKGQLGDLKEDQWTPKAIPGIPFHVVRAVCGKDFTFVVSEPNDGRNVVLGSDKWNIRSNAPSAIRGWKDIGASWGSIYVLNNSGELLGWGRNDHGQLPPPTTPPIETFAAGSEHCVASTENRRVLAWGWGEHGNCGQRRVDDHPHAEWNELTALSAAEPIFVAAGCATTWIFTHLHNQTT